MWIYVLTTIATILSLGGALILSYGKPALVKYTALAFLLGSTLWAVYAILLQLWPVLILNVAFAMIEARSVYHWCIRPYLSK